MKTLYIDCGGGARKDTITGALVNLQDVQDAQDLMKRFNTLGICGLRVRAQGNCKCGMGGLRLDMVDGEGRAHLRDADGGIHRSLADVIEIAQASGLDGRVQEKVIEVYGLLAQAEASAHGVRSEDVHFHEVGSDEAIAYVALACMAFVEAAPDETVASPITTGFGTVECAHGTLPIPAPATANLLEGIPSEAGEEEGELCTPTGAALIKAFADSFGPAPAMDVTAVGYGQDSFGDSCLQRAVLGERKDA